MAGLSESGCLWPMTSLAHDRRQGRGRISHDAVNTHVQEAVHRRRIINDPHVDL